MEVVRPTGGSGCCFGDELMVSRFSFVGGALAGGWKGRLGVVG